MRNAYRSFAGLYSELGRGMSVLTVDYRVAPEHPYPAALEDAITGYNWLLQQAGRSMRLLLPEIPPVADWRWHSVCI